MLNNNEEDHVRYSRDIKSLLFRYNFCSSFRRVSRRSHAISDMYYFILDAYYTPYYTYTCEVTTEAMVAFFIVTRETRTIFKRLLFP